MLLRIIILGLTVSLIVSVVALAVAKWLTPVHFAPQLHINYPPTREVVLPQRLPMASLSLNPAPETFQLHTNKVPRCPLIKRIAFQRVILRARFQKWYDTLIIEDSETFTIWWSTTATNDRKRAYHGKRRYEDKINTPAFRERWAAWGTQEWPTLATTGNAYDQDLVPLPSINDVFVDRSRIDYDTGDSTMKHLERAWVETGAFPDAELHRPAFAAA